jgi:uncharacterized protein (TIGR03435 family)
MRMQTILTIRQSRPDLARNALVAFAGMAWLATGPGVAQQPPASTPTFEAASVKLSNSGGGPITQVLPGRLVAKYSSLQDLIAFSYEVRTDQLIGATSWIVSDHYDLEAKAAGNPPAGQIAGVMLRALLEDRFKLVLHREKRELPVYELRVDRSGLRLQPTKEGSCTLFSPDSSPLPPAPDAARLPFCGPRTGRNGSNWALNGQGVRMEALAGVLSFQLNRTVLDKTGLTGSYDVHLQWMEDPLTPGTLGSPGAPPAPDDPSGPSLFTSLHEQLGLRMVSAKGPIEVLVIDHAERPSEN